METDFSNDQLIVANKAIIKMAVESWRFSRAVERMLLKLDAGEQQRHASALRWFVKRIEDSLGECGYFVVNVEGHPFEPGLAATPLNIDDFDVEESLVVEHMIEPIIMSKQEECLVRSGTVTLRRISR